MFNDAVFHELAIALEAQGPVTIGTMFRRPGIRIGGKIVAFLGHDDELILKVPRARALQLVDDGIACARDYGHANQARMVSVPAAHDSEATLTLWFPLALEALTYVRELGAKAAGSQQ